MIRSGAVIVLCVAATAHANPDAIVPSAGDNSTLSTTSTLGVAHAATADVVVHLDYEYEVDSSTVTREHAGAPGTDPLGPLQVPPEFHFHQYRHLLTPGIDVGLAHGTWFSVSLPIVLAQQRELSLASGPDRGTNLTIADGILPPTGYDARDPSTPPPGDLVFRGIDRHGLDQVYLGVGFAPMVQAHDDTKPTWKLGAEFRLAVGKIMRFDPTNTQGETGVSRGVDELRLWTSIDRHYSWSEAWFEGFWQIPVYTRSGSLFQDPGYGATNTGLSQQAGAGFGFEAYAVDDQLNGNRISIDLGARFTGHFEGRDYSEMWEVFALAGRAGSGGPLILDADPTTDGVQALSHPGITNIENYLESSGQIAIRAALGPHVRFSALGKVTWKTAHVITFADAGVDLPTCTGGKTTGCEVDNNDLVTPGTAEVNPLHSQPIDLVGHRYHSEDNLGVVIGIQSEILF